MIHFRNQLRFYRVHGNSATKTLSSACVWRSGYNKITNWTHWLSIDVCGDILRHELPTCSWLLVRALCEIQVSESANSLAHLHSQARVNDHVDMLFLFRSLSGNPCLNCGDFYSRYVETCCDIGPAHSIIHTPGIILFCVCFLTALLSLSLTITAIGGFLLYRLVFLLRSRETWTAGFKAWTEEVRMHAISRMPKGASSGSD